MLARLTSHDPLMSTGANDMTPEMKFFQSALEQELKGLFFDLRFRLKAEKSIELLYFSTLNRQRPVPYFLHYKTLNLPEKLSPETIKTSAQLCVQKAISDLKQAGHL